MGYINFLFPSNCSSLPQLLKSPKPSASEISILNSPQILTMSAPGASLPEAIQKYDVPLEDLFKNLPEAQGLDAIRTSVWITALDKNKKKNLALAVACTGPETDEYEPVWGISYPPKTSAHPMARRPAQPETLLDAVRDLCLGQAGVEIDTFNEAIWRKTFTCKEGPREGEKVGQIAFVVTVLYPRRGRDAQGKRKT